MTMTMMMTVRRMTVRWLTMREECDQRTASVRDREGGSENPNPNASAGVERVVVGVRGWGYDGWGGSG